jgi:hypothetical protein
VSACDLDCNLLGTRCAAAWPIRRQRLALEGEGQSPAAYAISEGWLTCPGVNHGAITKQANEDLVLYLTGCECGVAGSSIGVAAALGLLCLVLGLKPVRGVVVTGSLKLNGRVGEAYGLVGKIQV